MSGKLVSLVTARPGDPDSDLVTTIEELLKDAKSGELQGLGYAALYSDGAYKANWDGKATCLPLLGAITILHHDFSTAVASLDEDDS